MILETITVGSLMTNCYIFGDESLAEAILIDPGAESKKIKSRLKKTGLRLKGIVNTHGHADHIGANSSFGVPVWIHKDDTEFLADSSKNLSAYVDEVITSSAADKLLVEGELIEVGNLKLEVLHTPGHTPGGICLKFNSQFIFTGDTLFGEGGVGRTDFPLASNQQLWASISKRLFTLPDNMIIYPGHGPASTIGREKDIHGYRSKQPSKGQI